MIKCLGDCRCGHDPTNEGVVVEWIDYVAKGIGALVALGTLLKVGSELYTKFKNGSEFGMWFGGSSELSVGDRVLVGGCG